MESTVATPRERGYLGSAFRLTLDLIEEKGWRAAIRGCARVVAQAHRQRRALELSESLHLAQGRPHEHLEGHQ